MNQRRHDLYRLDIGTQRDDNGCAGFTADMVVLNRDEIRYFGFFCTRIGINVELSQALNPLKFSTRQPCAGDIHAVLS